MLSSTSFVLGGCGEHAASTASAAGFGSIEVAVVQGGVTLSSVAYSITGPNGFSLTGPVNVSASSTISTLIAGIPAGVGYTIALTSTAVDGATTCAGSSSFNITAGAVTTATVTLDCHQAPKAGSVAVKGTLNVCPVADGLSASPADVAVGFPNRSGHHGPRLGQRSIAARVLLDGSLRQLQ